MNKIKLGIIFGGMSTEHGVSVCSATSIIKNLNHDKYEIFPIYIAENGKWFNYVKPIEQIEILKVGEKVEPIQEIENEIKFLKNLDVVFPVLHGLYGEDGTIQGLLELLKIKYVGCRVLSSSICMDKAYTKIIFQKANIPQAKYIYIKTDYINKKYYYIDNEMNEQILSIDQIILKVKENIKLPVFVKPSNSGSSVGIKKANNEEELKQAIIYASQFDNKILIEEEIIGREIECAVLGNEEVKATNIGEILPAEEFYTFDAKYNNSESRVIIPAQIEQTQKEKIRELAIKAFKAVDGKGLSRVDFFIEKETQKVYINEINTLPGFTQISMYPKLWEESGISYTELLDKLIELAY